MTPWKRSGRAEASLGPKHVLNHTRYAGGWEQGSQLGLHHPNDQDWLDGFWAGYYDAMDRRFPGWRKPVDDDEDEED